MNSTAASSTSSTAKSCTWISLLPPDQQDLINGFLAYRPYLSIVMIIGQLIALIFQVISLIIFILLYQWKNSAKIYYIYITVTNLFTSLIVDLSSKTSTYLLFIYISLLHQIPLRLVNPDSFSAEMCGIMNFLRYTLPTLNIWILATFAVHRALIVCFPMNPRFKSKYFPLITLNLVILVIIISFSPHYFVNASTGFKIISGNGFCTNVLEGYTFISFWKGYNGSYITLLENILPLSLVLVANIIIIWVINVAASKRLHMTITKVSASESKTIYILISLSVLYFICSLPTSILQIILTFFADCRSKNVVLYSFAANYVFFAQDFKIFIRISDTVIFLVMIREFRRTISRILCPTTNS